MKQFREGLRLVGFNWRGLALFELVYKALTALVLTPLLLGGLNLLMRLRGFAYITPANLAAFLLHPLTLLGILVLLALAAACAMVDIGAAVFALDQAKQGTRVSAGQILRFSVKNAARVLHRRNILLVPVVVLMLPLLNIGLASGFLTTVSIPEFILDFILNNRLLSLLFCALMAGLTYLAVRWFYAFHYFTLEGCDFSAAHRRSAALGKGKRLADFGAMLVYQLLFALLYLALLVVAITLAGLLGKLFSGVFLVKWLGSTLVWTIIALMLAVIAALAVPLGYGCVSALFYRRKEEKGEVIAHSEAPEPRAPRFPKAMKVGKAVLSCAVLVGACVLGYLLCSGRINPEIEYLRTTQVTAHRGASVRYPENTMAAFRGARELGADWVELDVQQSRDGQIFVQHDGSFKRTTGVDAEAWELDYAEIAKLDAGSFFSPEFAGEHIPLLSEVLEFAKESGTKLNIELKPSGHEVDFEQCVVDEIRKAGMAENCVVTSLNYDVLERVKACDPEITTVYVMSLAYGEIEKLEAADDFSVEASSATRTLIRRVHDAGREIYAWTVNTQENIDKMIGYGVDNIITDDIELARARVYESRYSNILAEYMKLFQ